MKKLLLSFILCGALAQPCFGMKNNKPVARKSHSQNLIQREYEKQPYGMQNCRLQEYFQEELIKTALKFKHHNVALFLQKDMLPQKIAMISAMLQQGNSQ